MDYIYIYIYIYMGGEARAAARGGEFTKGGLVKGGLAMTI